MVCFCVYLFIFIIFFLNICLAKEGSIACPCLLFFLKNFTALCFSSSQQHRKSINQKLFSLETVYLWSISSLNKIHIACF